MKNGMRWFRPLPLLVSAALIGGSGICLAQNTNSGDLRGTATDTTGAIIPGVTVTVLDIDKGVSRAFVTDGAGLYDTGPIPEDHYKITFTKDGFETFVRGPVTVNLGIETVNGEMKVGAVSQQVVVTTDVPALNTESGAIEGDMQSSTMAELPQVGSGNGGGADWENFIVLMPGAAGTPENSNNVANQNIGQASINGNLPYASVLQDGATTTLPMSQNSDVTVFETTSEVKVSATAFSAQYGVGDIVYNQITKSGTDHFHGAAYEYNQNTFFDAANYAFGTGKVNIVHFNNFGGAIGGPVLPRHLFHKSFFYFDYDRTINNGTGSVKTVTLPSTAMMGGDFTQAGLPTLFDPTQQTIVNTGTCTYTGPQYPHGSLPVPAPCVQRTSFEQEAGHPGDQAYNVIPSGMIDPAAAAIQKYLLTTTGYPAKVSSYSQNNFSILPPVANTPFIKWFGRWDTDLTANNRLTAAETKSDNPSFGTDIFYPLNNQNQDVSRDNAQVSDVWTVNSHLINEARMGFTDQLNFFEPVSEGKNYQTLLDMPILKADAFPGGNGTGINISSFDGFTSASHSVYKEFVFDPSDVVTLIKGRHVLHFGGEFLINRADSTAWGNIDSGEFTMNGQYTAAGGGSTNAYDGMSYADFLLGQVNNWGGAKVAPEFAGRWKAPQLFVQDDVKARPNLTVNIGLRWEGETGWRDAKGNEAVFDPAVQNFNFTPSGAVPTAPVNGVAPGAPVQGGMWYGFLGQNGRTSLQAPKYDIFLPRVGFSWEIRPNTVIRGGIGLFASTWSEDTYGGGEGNAFGSSGGVGDTTDGICPVVQLSADGNSPDTTDPGCGIGNFNPTSPNSHYVTAPTTPWASNGGGPSYNEYHTPVPLNYQWNLTVERQFLRDWTASVSYVGNHGNHLNFPVDINQVPENKLGPNDAQYQPYPIFQGMTGSTNNAISNYHAMQAVLNKRFSYGLQLSTNYTWSHFLDDQDSSGWGSREGYNNYQNSYLPSKNYSNSNFDIRHMLKGEAVYQLPFGKGMMFLNNSQVADEVLGGWQTAFTFVAQTGNPLSITTGNNNSSNNQSGGYTQFANRVGDYKTADSVTGNAYHSLKEWYNLQALAVPAPYTYGDFVRNTVYGPHLVNFNFSLGKSFDVWPEKDVKFQIRGMATNIFNHPNFGQPGNNAIGGGESAQITTITGSGRLWEMYGRLSF